ncbi:glycosyltransferase family 4 protein [Nonomuraea spiralis]|uniref:glycosyltransferase family 4 protein n=1 Tax=Nonomuraea TaxID=83681 RepID=UPI000F7A951E|nr:glycosyltransferase family 4 protein [Nonomuraea sp. WAC 01424]RSN02684.1 glycosyl transferase [Nonomuraea sp. WAC 01424]
MRVAFVVGTTSGGTGRHVRMLVEGLVRRGHQVAVVGPGSVEKAFSYREAGAAFAEVPVSDRPHPFNDLRAVFAIRRLTRDADVVHAHGLRAGALAGLALSGAGRRRAGSGRLVVTLHNALTAGGFVGFVYGVLERVVARRADRVLVVSPDLGERMTALGARQVADAVVPAPALRPARRTPDEVREELGAGDRPLVLTVGRLAQQKGFDTLLEVAAGPWEAPVPLFAVAGEGPLRTELQERIRERGLPVLLLGDRDDVPDLLAAAAVVVNCSRWEGLPLSLSEALMAGKPVIASAVGGIPWLVGDAGTLVPYGDAEGMRGALRKVLAEPGIARTMAEAAARRGRELPDGDDAVESVLGVYEAARSIG